ncbi:MAG: glucosidase, partial [Chryseobacterium sp.]
MIAEKQRLKDTNWKNWGPYVSNRQWGNVREDYSSNGDAWNFANHDAAESYAYRWGEEGIAGISDVKQLLCFAFSFWNKRDRIVKERLFGLSNPEGNHGEDIKEIFYYLDNTPTHSYMKMVYKYPMNAFPYDKIRSENAKRSKKEPEYEIIDTGIFDKDEYFDIFIEYAKADHNDILIRITVCNRSEISAPIVIAPTVWFRNNWKWGYNTYKAQLNAANDGSISINHDSISIKKFYSRNDNAQSVFCENETNNPKLYGTPYPGNTYFKDGINDYIIYGSNTINPEKTGTKASFLIDETIEAGASKTFDFRLSPNNLDEPFDQFDQIFDQRMDEANEFYDEIQNDVVNDDERNVQRQAFAGLLWNKQFYHYNVGKWLKGDPNFDAPRDFSNYVRNTEWNHMHNKDIISMPDKWEYPWYATWDL